VRELDALRPNQQAIVTVKWHANIILRRFEINERFEI
jgi:hypothetical protein